MQICICRIRVEYVNLKDICKINMGQSPDSTSYNSDKQGVPFYQGNADFGALYPKPRIWCNKPIKLAKENDILISVRAPVGALNFSKEECCIGRGLASITLDSNDFLLEFIYWSLRTGVKELQNKSTGSTFKSINKKTLEEVRIPKVPLKEQKDIIRNLTLLTNILAKYKHEIVFLDELVKARFVEMFGDPNIEFKYNSIKFNDLVVRMTKGPFGSDMKKDLFVPKGEDTYKVYIQINAIQKNQSLGEYYISKEYFDRKVSRFELFPNDYIITCDGTLGKYLKLDENMEKGVISPSLLRLTLQSDKINDKYFENIWDFYMLGLMKKEARNACLVHLPSAKKIGEISIPIPPLELQNQFASFVQEIDKSRLLSNHSLSLIKSIIF